MKKTIFAFLILFVLFSAETLAYIQRVYPIEADKTTHEFIVTLYNPTQYNEKEVQLSVYIPYLDIKGKSGNFAIKSEKTGRAYIEVDLEDAKSGYYPVILTFQNENVREKKHSWIYIN